MLLLVQAPILSLLEDDQLWRLTQDMICWPLSGKHKQTKYMVFRNTERGKDTASFGKFCSLMEERKDRRRIKNGWTMSFDM